MQFERVVPSIAPGSDRPSRRLQRPAVVDSQTCVARQRRARTRARISGVAVQVFATKAPDTPVIDDLIRAAGSARGVLQSIQDGRRASGRHVEVAGGRVDAPDRSGKRGTRRLSAASDDWRAARVGPGLRGVRRGILAAASAKCVACGKNVLLIPSPGPPDRPARVPTFRSRTPNRN
jgi:hypothetical protein